MVQGFRDEEKNTKGDRKEATNVAFQSNFPLFDNIYDLVTKPMDYSYANLSKLLDTRSLV